MRDRGQVHAGLNRKYPYGRCANAGYAHSPPQRLADRWLATDGSPRPVSTGRGVGGEGQTDPRRVYSNPLANTASPASTVFTDAVLLPIAGSLYGATGLNVASLVSVVPDGVPAATMAATM